ncbi:response regulator [Rhizobium leucaenae]|uniref:CheY-like chemotaxis protein n=1 Tax=Rhizobium leucaenae TaxID=29450 RepID=A0A7W6ZV08_9HYPH|nr:response regulator [Rhizobium leucaenae]MBB4569274.1 CheY-like chemotaxis protein [Rhizobium leucaenae]MBB6302726.1 CheY-like chemotaxis protein [Rhizobium leucaenae]
MQWRLGITSAELAIGAGPAVHYRFSRGLTMALEGLRVLLVEDEGLIAMLTEDMLQDLGCSVAAGASTVAEAIEKVQAGGFDLALLDVDLVGKKVFPVAELLATQGIPFAFASGYGESALPEEFRQRPVLPKPFHINELAAALSAALNGEG